MIGKSPKAMYDVLANSSKQSGGKGRRITEASLKTYCHAISKGSLEKRGGEGGEHGEGSPKREGGEGETGRCVQKASWEDFQLDSLL